jgi:integrase
VTITRNAATGFWEADITDRKLGRIHISLKTKRKAEADDRHAALKALMREGHADLVQQLRDRKLNIEAVTRAHRDRTPFAKLAESAWPTLGVAREEYVAWLEAKPKTAPNTVRQATTLLAAAVEHFGEDKTLDAITVDQIAKWQAELVQGTEERGPRDPESTVPAYLVRLSALFNWTQKREKRQALEMQRPMRLLANPIDRELVPTAKEGRKRFLSVEEAERLIAATPEQFKFAVRAGLFAGLRLGEMLTLRPPPFDLDLVHRLIAIQSKGDWRPKTPSSTRHIPIADDLDQSIECQIAAYASTDWMVPGLKRSDVHLSAKQFQKIFARIVEDAGLMPGRIHPNGVTYHTLRHTFASWLVMAGVDLWTVAKLLGHKDIKEVEKTYAHLAPDHLKAAIGKLGKYWRPDITPPAERRKA